MFFIFFDVAFKTVFSYALTLFFLSIQYIYELVFLSLTFSRKAVAKLRTLFKLSKSFFEKF